MKLRRLAAATVGVAGAAALGNRALRAKADELDPALPGQTGTFRWRGFDVSYAEGGDPEDQDLLLLHGVHATATNKEFDRVFDRLAETYHVVAPDLPGFGLSDRPPLLYSASLYRSFVTDFARDVTDDAICMASSLSGAYAAAAQADAAPFSRLVLVAPVGDTGPKRAWLRTLFRTPVVGTALFNGMASKPAIWYFSDRESVVDTATITAEDVDYYWRTAHQQGVRFAPASFVSGYLDVERDLGDLLADVDVPVTLVWGRESPFPPLSAGRELARYADVRLVVIDEAKLLPHHEHPDVFIDALADELPAVVGE
ncbi:alpha/beta hydrolase [Halobacteriales archaeon QS_1_68_20]|nr:MAG: alpha/beta hydrolase [Halobacteriales archaeon QS_1_68_20]